MGSIRMVDIVLLVVFLAFSTTVISFFVKSVDKNLSFTVENKSSIDVKSEINRVSEVKTGSDLLMSLVLVDDFIMYPRAIRINDTPVIKITDEWILGKAAHIREIYDTGGVYKLGSMLNYKIESVTYVYDANGDYLQYRLIP